MKGFFSLFFPLKIISPFRRLNSLSGFKPAVFLYSNFVVNFFFFSPLLTLNGLPFYCCRAYFTNFSFVDQGESKINRGKKNDLIFIPFFGAVFFQRKMPERIFSRLTRPPRIFESFDNGFLVDIFLHKRPKSAPLMKRK